MKETVCVDLSEEFRGQFKINGDEAALMPFVHSGILARDHLLKNSDRIVELCQTMARTMEVMFTERAAERLRQVRDESPIESPSLTLPFELKRFQNRCGHALDGVPNTMLICSCGTGKTAMGTMLAVREFDRGTVDKIVVFCPAPLVKQWVPWLEKATSLTVGTVNRNAKPAKRQAWYNTDDSDIWVVNYDRTNTKDWNFIERALRGKHLFFVYDEVQRLKSRARPRHQKFKKLEKTLDIRFKCGLTATPLEKSPEDYYNEWRILDASIYGTVKDFEHYFTYGNGERDMWNRYLGFQNLDVMGLLSAPRVFMAEKTNPEIAAEFPKRQEIVLDLELSPPERALYDEIAAYGGSVDRDEKQRSLFMLMLQRVCRMPEVLLMEDVWRYEGDNPFWDEQLREIRRIVQRHAPELAGSKNSEKLKATEELVDQIMGGGEKMVVFAQHTHNCLIPLSKHLERYRPLMYMGGQTDAQRGVIERSFREGSTYNLMLMSDAGREGIDLPEGRYLLHYDTPPLHSRYQQRSDRIHRISSKHDCVTIYRFVTRDTIEERIEETMAGRKALAQEMGMTAEELQDVVVSLHEFNPMMGHRGCRLSVTYPEIAEMQTNAVIKAALKVSAETGKMITPYIMIPLVGERKELKFVRDIVVRTADALIKEAGVDMKYHVGTMIEIPRAALTADEIAKEADFFSFGTNDLTQMTFGFSRDDAAKFLGSYYDTKIYESDPFQHLDINGVGKLVEMACKLGRQTNPELELGICGEHGGDPSSVEFCHKVGLDYVSCSPFRVPIARLAAAQAAIREEQ